MINIKHFNSEEKSGVFFHENILLRDVFRIYLEPSDLRNRVKIYYNQREITQHLLTDDLDIVIKPDDDLVIELKPTGAAFAAIGLTGQFWELVGGFIFSLGISWLIGKLFAPKEPEQEEDTDSSVYSLNTQNNIARKGSTIPIVYGSVWMTPSLISKPHYWNKNSTNEEYVGFLMCLGQGSIAVSEIQVGNEDAEMLPESDFYSEVITPSKIKNNPNVFEELDDTGIWNELVRQLDMASSIEVRGIPANMRQNVRIDPNATNEVWVYPDYRNKFKDLYLASIGDFVEIDIGPNKGKYFIKQIHGGDSPSNPWRFSLTTDEDLNNDADLIPFPSEEDRDWKPVFDNKYSLGNYIQEHDKKRIYIKYTDTTGDDEDIYEPIAKWDGVMEIKNNATNENLGIYSFKYIGTADKVSPKPDDYEYTWWEEDNPQGDVMEWRWVAQKGEFAFASVYGPYNIQRKTPHKRHLKSIEIDVQAPQGIFDVNDNGDYQSKTVEYEFIFDYTKSNGSEGRVHKTASMSGDSSKQLRKTHRYKITNYNFPNIDTNSDIMIKIRKVTKESEDPSASDSIQIQRVKGCYGFEDFTENNKDRYTYLFVKAKASASISQRGTFQVKAKLYRPKTKLTDVIYDLYTNKRYGAGLSGDDLLFPSVVDRYVNGVFDKKMTVLDGLQSVCEPQGYFIYPHSSYLKIRKDEKQSSKFQFSDTNIIKDTLSYTNVFGSNTTSQNDGVKVSWFDNEEWIKQEYTYPEDALNPQSIELFGITEEEKAKYCAKFIYNKRKYRNSNIEFSTDIQGYIPQYLDRISVTHSLFEINPKTDKILNGQILGVYVNKGSISNPDFELNDSGNWLLLSTENNRYSDNVEIKDLIGQEIICDQGIDCLLPLYCDDSGVIFDKIQFRDIYGKPSVVRKCESYLFQNTNHKKYIMVHCANRDDWVTGIQNTKIKERGTFYALGAGSEITKDYIIEKITVTPSNQPGSGTQDVKVKIQGYIYDERVYDESGEFPTTIQDQQKERGYLV